MLRKTLKLKTSFKVIVSQTLEPEFEFIMENLVEKEVFQTNKTLAGYGMNKSNANSILFMKEEVLQEHIKFLTNTPSPIYEPDPVEDHINI